MDQWNTELELHHHNQQQKQQHMPKFHSEQREMTEMEAKDTSDARKVQKADREKLRRDRLNEQFIELGNLLDPDRPKNDKASIIIDTIQVLKDLTTEVNRLKGECAALSEESSELTQEKNELREEKSTLTSDVENLSAQYQQRGGVMFPWSVPPPYSLPVQMHPFPYFGNHNPPGVVPTYSTALMPYLNAPNAHINQTIPVLCTPNSYGSSSDRFRNSNNEKGDNSSDVVTELELKTPGSRSDQESLSGDKKGKHPERKEKGVPVTDGGCSSSRYTSSQGFQVQDSSLNSLVDNNE